MRRVAVVGCTALFCAAGLIAGVPATRAATCGTAAGEHTNDIVVGVPAKGVVDIRDASGATRHLTGGSGFGSSVALVDINGDLCTDLVIGAPGAGGIGAVRIVLGTPAGVGTGLQKVWPYAGATGDRFGAAVAVQQVSSTAPANRFAHIWVGAPGVDVAGKSDAGAVVYYKVTSDLTVFGPTVRTQDRADVPGSSEPGDQFGEVIQASYNAAIIGVPHEDLGGHADAGMAVVLPAPGASPAGYGPYAIGQDSPDTPDLAETGDLFGASVSAGRFSPIGPVWIGAPGEDVDAATDAGIVHMFSLDQSSAASNVAVTQNSPDIAGTAQSGDRFGAVLQDGFFSWGCGGDQVAIGVPGEDVGGLPDAGAVDYYNYTTGGAQCSYAAWTQAGGAAAGEQTGAGVGLLMAQQATSDNPVDYVLVGTPGEDVAGHPDAGAARSTRGFVSCCGTGRGYSAQFTYSAGATTDARYGTVFGVLAYDFGP